MGEAVLLVWDHTSTSCNNSIDNIDGLFCPEKEIWRDGIPIYACFIYSCGGTYRFRIYCEKLSAVPGGDVLVEVGQRIESEGLRYLWMQR